MIRWKGFLPLLLFSTLLAISYIFYANYLVKSTVELLGWEINQASVDLQNAKVSLSPLGIDMRQLQVANAKTPERNSVEIGKISFKMDLAQIFHLNWVINEMHVNNVRFNTQREFPAQVAKLPATKVSHSKDRETENSKETSTSSDELKKDVGNLLDNENLHTLQLAEALQKKSHTLKANWQSARQNLPTKEKLDSYKTRVKKLEIDKAKDLVKQRKEISAIRKELKTDIRTLSSAHKNILSDAKLIDNDYKELRSVYKKELQQLKKKYAFNQHGMENYARLFFGNSSNKWLRDGLYWYAKLKPYLSNSNSTPSPPPVNRWKGTNIAFYDRNPTPRFLLKSAKLSIITDMGEIGGQLLDLSSDQHKTNRPAKLKLHSTDLNRAKSLDAEAIFDFTKKIGTTTIKTQVLQWQIEDWAISKDGKFPLKLQKAKVDFTIDAKIIKDRLHGGFRASFKQAQFETKTDATGMSAVINNAFHNIQQFSLFGKLKGNISKPGISLRSDLDSVIKSAMGAEVKKMSLAYQKRVEEKLNEKMQTKLGDSEMSKADIDNLGKDIANLKKHKEDYLAQLEQKLKQKKNIKIHNKRDRLKNKLKNKLKF